MRILIDKLILLAACFLLQLYYYPDIGLTHILTFLFALTFLCLCTCCNPDMVPFRSLKPIVRCIQVVLILLFLLLALLCPMCTLFLPLLFYELTEDKPWHLFVSLCLTFFIFRWQETWAFLLVILLFVLAFFLKQKTKRLLQLENNIKLLCDSSTESNLLLQQKNQELIRQQDYEIYAAILKERNRIAREIHDNIGHMLSRSILQSGALIAMNKDPNLNEPLSSLKDTLSLAMNSVRESVHDLHDDSIDLKSSLYHMIQDLSSYDVTLDYDMGELIPKNIKYCFIAIVKEGLSNIFKHSNATRIRITVREHPAFYQLIIEDNGTNISLASSGIGLENMRERIEQLHGRFSITTEQGFRIFISVPKNKN